MFTLTDTWDCCWMLKHSQLHILHEKRSFYPPHALKIYIVFPICFAARCLPASYEMLECMFSLPAGSYVFLYPLLQALVGCLHYALKLGGVINS